MFKYRISGVRKKKEKKRFWGEDVWVEFFLLSSCSLVRLYVNLQVKVTEKKNGNFQSILRELKLRLQRKFKIRDFYLLGSYPLVGRHVD